MDIANTSWTHSSERPQSSPVVTELQISYLFGVIHCVLFNKQILQNYIQSPLRRNIACVKISGLVMKILYLYL